MMNLVSTTPAAPSTPDLGPDDLASRLRGLEKQLDALRDQIGEK